MGCDASSVRVHSGEGAKGMNAFFQWLVHGEVEDINDSSSLHHNGNTIDNNKEEWYTGRSKSGLGSGILPLQFWSGRRTPNHRIITELWNTTKQGIGHTRLNGTSHFQLVML